MRIFAVTLFLSLLAGPGQRFAVRIVQADGKGHAVGRTYVAPTLGLDVVEGKAIEGEVLYCAQVTIVRGSQDFVGFRCDGGKVLELKAIYF